MSDSNVPRDRKKSDFTEQGVIPAGATFDYVYNGTNYKISVADMIAAFGTTGTLEQVGDPTQTPILKQVGAVNQIRTLEDGAGIKASISPQGGALLDHNFTVDSTGIPILSNSAAASPTLRSILAGSGITVAVSNGSIQIALSATPATTKTVIVNVLADFPTPAANVITLEADTLYFLTNDIAAGANRFVLSDTTIIDGSDGLLIELSYTGSGTMFTGLNVTGRIKNLILSCPNGQLFDFTGTGSESFFFNSCVVSKCDTVGSIEDMLFFSLDDVAFQDIITAGITFAGSISLLSLTKIVVGQNGGIFIDLGVVVFNGISINFIKATLAAGTTFLSGAVDSVNISSGGLGAVTNTRISGAGTVLTGIVSTDNLWVFDSNNAIPDSRDAALMNNTGVTVTISTINTPVKIDGNWVEQNVSRFETATSGTMTYKGPGAHVSLNVTVTAESALSSKDFTFYFALNGTEITASGIPRTLTAGTPGNLTLFWSLELSTDDEIEVWVENNTDSTNCVINSAIVRID